MGHRSPQGGKRHEMPAHHNLEAYLDAYIKAAGVGDDGKSPLFRSAAGRTGALTDKPVTGKRAGIGISGPTTRP
jgi:hypothetical protein